MKIAQQYIAILSALCLLECTHEEKLFTRLNGNETNIDFVNENTETERSNVLTYEYFYNGGGVALGDINNDGLVDVYFSSNIYDNKLYLNKGNFRFEDITNTSGTACSVGWKTGVSMVDINNDGYLDIYVCRSASPDAERRRNILLINNRNNTFTDRAKEYNLDDPSFSTQAAFFDFDRDGDLDAFLLNHSTLEFSNSFLVNPKNSKERFPFVGNKLMRNDNGKFIDVSDNAGIYGPASNYGLGVSISDINNDGWPDIYAGCDYTGSDRLLVNVEGKFFNDITDTLSHISKFTMGTDIADVNGDGLMDIFTLDMLPEDNYRQKQLLGADKIDAHNAMVKNGLHHQYMRNMLHLNLGHGMFSEIGQLAGISNTDWSWGALFADFDNDGFQDLFITNGFKRDLTDNDFAKYKAFEEIHEGQRQGNKTSSLKVIDKFTENRIPNYMFRGDGQLSFGNVTKMWGLDQATLANGVAYGDLDNDGDLDLVTNNINDAAGVYRNNANMQTSANSYLKVRLVGDSLNRSAIGSRVIVFSKGKKYVREQMPVRGFQSTVDPTLHFGLGSVTQVDSVVVQWPDNTYQLFTHVSVNKLLEVEKDHRSRQIQRDTNTPPYFQSVSDVIPFRHEENEFIDFRVQPLLPRQYSHEGPAVVVGDVNGDGAQDIFIGGAFGQTSELLIASGADYFHDTLSAFNEDLKHEIVDAAFVDVDGDKDLDLYAVTGGYEFKINDPALQDLLYINNGKGKFVKRVLPEMYVSGSCVRPSDVDADGDIDLFVGGRIIPGRYPETPETVLLINDGSGNFTKDDAIPSTLKSAGMVTDGLWVDLNADRQDDLVVIGEWMPVKVFINQKGKFVDRSNEFVPTSSSGFWNCIVSDDFDNDGDVDLLIGNQGRNTQMKPTETLPITVTFHDFDKNGSVDPILSYGIQGGMYPYASRDELTEQLPSFKKRFGDYKSYSKAHLGDILSQEERDQAKQFTVATVETSLFRNDAGKFTIIAMPEEMQIAPVTSLLLVDVDGDGIEDLVSGGNLSATRARSGRMSGNVGFVFRADGKGKFEFVPPLYTGIYVSGDVKRIAEVQDRLIFFVNNDFPKSFKISKPKTIVKK